MPVPRLHRRVRSSALALTLALCATLPARAALVRYYPFDNDLADLSGNGQDATKVGANTTFSAAVPAAIGARSTAAVSLPGSSGHYVSLPFADFNGLTASGATLSMWVKGAAQTDKRVFGEGSTTDTDPAYAIGSGGAGSTDKLRVFIRNASATVRKDASTTTPVFDDAWHHIGIVDNNGSVKVYVDGTLDANFASQTYTRDVTGVNVTAVGAFLRASDGSNFNGLIDDVGIFNFALSAADVALLAGGTSPTAVPEPGTLTVLSAAAAALTGRRRRPL